MGRKLSHRLSNNPIAERQIKNVSKYLQKLKTRVRASCAREIQLKGKTNCECKTTPVGVPGGEATAFLPLGKCVSKDKLLKIATKALKVERPKAIVPWLKMWPRKRSADKLLVINRRTDTNQVSDTK